MTCPTCGSVTDAPPLRWSREVPTGEGLYLRRVRNEYGWFKWTAIHPHLDFVRGVDPASIMDLREGDWYEYLGPLPD